MGCFDNIYCQVKLPLPTDLGETAGIINYQEISYQTKDLGQGMTDYGIREDGTLWKAIYTQSQMLKSTDLMLKSTDFLVEWEQLKDFTGTIKMYDVICLSYDWTDVDLRDKWNNDYFIEFKVTFVHGKVDSIELLKFEVRSNAERKKHRGFFSAKYKAQAEFKRRWYIRFMYAPYSRVVYWIFRKWRWLNRYIPSSYTLQRFLTPW